MSLIEAIVLGVVQGLTEFLPVSSSGHLALGEKLLEFGGPESVAFDVLVHVATLVAILIVVWPDIWRIMLRDRRVILLLAVGTIPAAVGGVLLDEHMEHIKTNLLAVGCFFLVTATLLLVAKWGARDRKELTEATLLESILVGVAQTLAILPGISRSGSTISASRLLGLRPRAAFAFSFLLGAIAIGGATLLKARDIDSLGDQLGLGVLAAAFTASLVSGLLALLVFRRLVVAGKLHHFAWYLVPLGLATIIAHYV